MNYKIGSKLDLENNILLNDYNNVELRIYPFNNNMLFKHFNNILRIEKEKIDGLENDINWDRMKKIGNPYELIYTSYNKKRKNDSISLYTPISRSYFKMWEIYHTFDLFKYFKENKHKIVFGHLAEGPGGFMEASYNYRKHIMNNVINDKFYCITLQPTTEYIPDFNKLKKIYGENNNIKIKYGNLYNIDDINGYIKYYETSKAHIVTADGGFDYSNNFNGQEINSCQIIYSECILALNILREKGCFVCKVFDLFSITMVQILYLLYEVFEEVHIYKPETSRPANSEKYIICLYYKDNLTETNKLNLLGLIKKWKDKTDTMTDEECILFNNFKVNNDFIKKLDEYNKIYIKQQMFYLNKTLELANSKFDKDKYYEIVQDQVTNAIKWCKKYKVEINKNSIYYKKNYI